MPTNAISFCCHRDKIVRLVCPRRAPHYLAAITRNNEFLGRVVFLIIASETSCYTHFRVSLYLAASRTLSSCTDTMSVIEFALKR